MRRRRLPSSEPIPRTRNVLRAWHAATDAERANGRLWYADAYAVAESLAQNRCLPVSCAAGVIAALSPRVAWADNIDAARMLLDGVTPSGIAFGRNIAKAQAILAYPDRDPLDVLRGPKTRAFYQCIMLAGAAAKRAYQLAQPVVVDGHAANLAWGRLHVSDTGLDLAKRRRYERIAEVYRRAAAQLCERVADVQAVTWLVHRRRLDAIDPRHAHQRKNVK